MLFLKDIDIYCTVVFQNDYINHETQLSHHSRFNLSRNRHKNQNNYNVNPGGECIVERSTYSILGAQRDM